MKNFLADYNQLAVSANAKQTAMGTAQTLDTRLSVPPSVFAVLEKIIDTNKGKATGYEEVTDRYDKGGRTNLSLPFDMCKPSDLAFLLAYHYAGIVSADWGTGRTHIFTPDNSKLLAPDFPAFTLGQRLGNSLCKQLYPDWFVDTLKVKWEKDKWLYAEGGCKGSGKETQNIVSETVNAAYNATDLPLAANAVEGATAAARLDSIHQVLVQVPATLEWKPVVVTAASGATPAHLTIEAPGVAATLTDYKILYVSTEAAWCTFPAEVAESPLLVGNMILNLGGKWDGSAVAGGDTLDLQFGSIAHSSSNGMVIEPRPANGASGLYANFAARGERSQTLTIDKDMRDYIMQQKFRDLDEFVVYFKATGAEFESGKNFYVETVFPRVGIQKVPVKVNGKVIGETLELIVMQHATYGSVRYKVANMVTNYAA